MSPRPDRRPESRPERGGRRPAGGSSGRPAARPGASFRPGGNRRPRWGPPEGEGGGERARPRREGAQPQGEWTPRRREGDSAPPRRIDAPRFSGRRPESGRPTERRWEPRPDRGGRFERRGEQGTERRPDQGRFSRPDGPRPAGGSSGSRPLPRPGARPRPPAELVGLQRRGGAPASRPPEAGEGEHFAGAAPSDLIWGRHSVQAALESGRPIHRIWCTPEMRFSPRFLQLLREAKSGGVLVEEVTWARLGQISGGAVHQGIVLQPAAAETLDLPTLIEGCRATGESPLLIAVDGLTDPQNLGAIVRSAEALGAHGLVLPQRRNAGLTGSVAKVAAGALEHLPVARVVNLNRSLESLKEEGYRVIGLASEGTITLEEADLDGPLVVVTGSEGDGLSLLTRRHCDQLVRIPLRGTTPSLNASVATALLLYEIARRGWMQGLRGTSPAPRLVRPSLPSPPPLGSAEPQEEPASAGMPSKDALLSSVAADAASASWTDLLSPAAEAGHDAGSAVQAASLEPQSAAPSDAGSSHPVATPDAGSLPDRNAAPASPELASTAAMPGSGADEASDAPGLTAWSDPCPSDPSATAADGGTAPEPGPAAGSDAAPAGKSPWDVFGEASAPELQPRDPRGGAPDQRSNGESSPEVPSQDPLTVRLHAAPQESDPIPPSFGTDIRL